MKKRQLLTMVLAGVMVMGTVGYGTPVLADSEKKDVKLGVSIMELTAYPWFQGVVDGCEQWADENADEKGMNIKFDFEDSHSDVQTMLTNLDNMQAAGCDGIILFPGRCFFGNSDYERMCKQWNSGSSRGLSSGNIF